MKRFSVILFAVSSIAWGGGCFAQEPPAAAKPPADQAKALPVGAEPGSTTATYGDWTLRCQRIGEDAKAGKVCEVVQMTQMESQRAPTTQIAIGRLPNDDGLHLTAALPVNLSFPSEIKVSMPGAKPITLTPELRRCLPVACFADMELKADQLKMLLAAETSGTLSFRDANGQTIAVPISPRGLPQAVAALQKDN
ncbi:invasion associated locus B family protein [Pleomorphomonas sp. PLEO]|uniref:invasion associated locus B family protein n=1 Tax=Pleomorphomonas sp. PLEO TaxID=3239306 RepID=UPI00351F283C